MLSSEFLTIFGTMSIVLVSSHDSWQSNVFSVANTNSPVGMWNTLCDHYPVVMNGSSFCPQVDLSPKLYNPDRMILLNTPCLIYLSILFDTRYSMLSMDVFISLKYFNALSFSASDLLISSIIYSASLN